MSRREHGGPEPARAELLAAHRSWVRAWESLDLEAWSGVFEEETAFLVLSRPIVRGAGPIREEIGEALRTPGLTTVMRTDDARVAGSGELGYVLGTYESSLGAGRSHTGKYLAVWKRTDAGAWRLVAFSSTPD